MATNSNSEKVIRTARLRWVRIALMKVNPLAQRDLNPNRVEHMAADFDLEQIGVPTVNERDGHFYVIDGQHRIEALRVMGWGDQQIQCWTYLGLTEAEEAEMFLKLNDVLTVDAMAKFRTGVMAGREVECDIDRIVRAQNCVVSRDRVPGGIRAVGTLRKVYTRSGPEALGRSLRIVRDAYGDAGMEALVIDGIGLVCQRYNGQLNDTEAVEKLAAAAGGVNGLLGKAENLRRATGNQKAHCVAAAVVEIVNRRKRGSAALPSWWKDDA